MTTYEFAGPPRFAHQKRGLKKIIANRGTAALLFEPGLGKGHPTDTPILTPSGWTPIGDLNRGDAITNSHGGRSRVTGVHDRGNLPVYRVTLSDGAWIDVDADHLWRLGRPRNGRMAWGTRNTRWLLRRAIDSSTGRLKGRWCIPVAQNIRSQIPDSRLPGPPLMLGHRIDRRKPNAPTRLPGIMLVASLESRRALMAALVDTTNLRTPNGARFVSPNLELARDVLRLGWSLGLTARLLDRSQPGAPQFHVILHEDRCPLRWIESIRPAGAAEVRCISVDAVDRLYVAKDWIVTHNTATVIDYASLLALQERRARVLVVAPLAAVDQWALQTPKWAGPQVDVWAEALGGTTRQKLEALRARAGGAVKAPEGGCGPGGAYRGVALHGQRSIAVSARRNGLKVPEEEARRGGPGLFDADERPLLMIEAMNLDILSQRRPAGSRTTADLVLDAVRRFAPHLMVVDESHLIKGVSSNASRLAARIGRWVPRRIILTGTVMPKSPLDVFAQWRFLDPKAFGRDGRDATYTGFRSEYTVRGGFMGYEVRGYRNLDRLREIMGRRAEVALKEEALDLPAATDVVVPVRLSKAEERAYGDMKKRLQATLLSGRRSTAMSRLAQMMRLRQITAGFLPDDDGCVEEIGDSKARTIASIVNDTLSGESRVVVFAVFRREIEVIRQAVARADSVVLTITGDTDPEDRLAMRRRFGSDDPQRIVLVAQIQTLSLAVNELVTAANAVFASLSTKRDEWVQARDRLNRVGQVRPCTFWYALVPGTVDEVQYDVYRRRSDLERSILMHVFDGDAGLVGKVVDAATGNVEDE